MQLLTILLLVPLTIVATLVLLTPSYSGLFLGLLAVVIYYAVIVIRASNWR